MQLQITSATGNILDISSFSQISLMTEMGEITVLPGHEPLLSAIRPGIMRVQYEKDNMTISEEYVSGGGVLQIDPGMITIVADVVATLDDIDDEDLIEAQKKEAEAMMENYRKENGSDLDPKRLLELEYELLKFTAMQELGKRARSEQSPGSRR